jgi:hypothetical protein
VRLEGGVHADSTELEGIGAGSIKSCLGSYRGLIASLADYFDGFRTDVVARAVGITEVLHGGD